MMPSNDAPMPASPGLPVIFERTYPHENLYHVAGEGFVTRDASEATRYPVATDQSHVTLDPWPGQTLSTRCSPVFDVLDLQGETLHLKWGERPLQFPLAHVFSNATRTASEQLGGFLRRGGTPFGPTCRIHCLPSGTEAGCYMDLTFLLPDGMAGLYVPLTRGEPVRGWSITWRLDLLGFRREGLCPKGMDSIWSLPLGDSCLSLRTGISAKPVTASFQGHTASLEGLSFADFLAGAHELAQLARTDPGEQALMRRFKQLYILGEPPLI